jgi:heme exporter protein D
MAPDAYREMLVAAHQKSSESYDKALMTLAGGALALSITFLHDIAPKPVHKGWLAWSWALLALSLLLTVASFLLSQKAILREIAKRDAHDASPANRWTRGTTTLNVLSGLLFILGVSCLVRFAFYNL